MSSKNRIKIIVSISVLIVIGMITYLVFYINNKDSNTKPNVGMIMSGSKDESGWNGMHYNGLKTACDKAGVNLYIKENVAEFSGKCEEALKELADKDVDMMVLSSYGYSEEVVDVVSDYPNIAFYANSSENHAKNMTSYFVRMYQARYMAGVLAGMRTKNNAIGYVAAMPNNEVNRGISAFTLGARSVNPKAEVIVMWSNSWDNSEKEAECAKTLIEKCKVDVITYHQNGSSVIDTAEKYGIESIGYHQHYEGYSDNYLTSVVCHWDKVYSELIKELLSGETNARDNMWIGLNEDSVGLSEFSDKITEEEKKAVEEAKEKIMAGKEVFSGLIYNMNGDIQCNEGEMISDEELLEKFDWYAQGVRIYEE